MSKINGNSNGNSVKSESITFRIGKPILDDLCEEADHKLNSVNTLVNQIIKVSMTWHKPAKQAGFGYFDNAMVSDMVNLLSDEQIVQMAEKYCKHRLKDIAFMLNSDNSFSSYIDGIISWLEVSAFSYKYNGNGDSKTLVIQFDMGRKWSLYFKAYMQQVLEHYGKKDSQCEMTDNTVVVNVKK